MKLALQIAVGWSRWWASVWQAGLASAPSSLPPQLAVAPMLAALDRP